MKKLLCIVLLAGLCIGLMGCGSKSDADIVKDVEKKIKSAGWEVKYRPQEALTKMKFKELDFCIQLLKFI